MTIADKVAESQCFIAVFGELPHALILIEGISRIKGSPPSVIPHACLQPNRPVLPRGSLVPPSGAPLGAWPVLQWGAIS
jgi:hypothetical protein